MGHSLLRKIVSDHLVSGKLIPGEEIGLKIDQAFAQDVTGPLACLEFEATGLERVQTASCVLYVDRGVQAARGEEADEQRYLESFAARYGAWFSRAGNGAAAAVHLDRFAVPGKTAIGADLQAPVCGALGMLAIAAGGLDLAAAMAGAPLFMPMPRVTGIRLCGTLGPWVTARDLGLEILRRLTIRGGVGRVLEFHGEALAGLTVPDRAAIAALAAETGAMAVLFPSDGQTRRFLEAQGRVRHFADLGADPGVEYDEDHVIDLGELEPLVARPGSPDDVVPVREIADTPVGQVVVGTAAAGSAADLSAVAALAEAHGLAERVAAVVQPATRQALLALVQTGDLARLLAAGWRVIEPGCGPEAGGALAPASGEAAVRTGTRNARGQSGQPDDRVYLASAWVAAMAAATGRLVDPRTLGIDPPRTAAPDRLALDDRLVASPAQAPGGAEVVRGPRIRPLPVRGPAGPRFEGPILIKLGDGVTAGDMAGPDTHALRTDAGLLAGQALARVDPGFAARCRAAGGGLIVAGRDFGSGPARELAAIALAALGIGVVIARDIARVHRVALVGHGIFPLLLASADDLDTLSAGDVIEIVDLRAAVRSDEAFALRNVTRGAEFLVRHGLTERQKDILLAGGMLPWARRYSLVPAGV